MSNGSQRQGSGTAVDCLRALRLVIGGDHLQLPAFVLSDTAKRLWPNSLLKDYVDKGFRWMSLAVSSASTYVIYPAFQPLRPMGLRGHGNLRVFCTRQRP